MNKKFIATLLTSVVSLAALAGCGNASQNVNAAAIQTEQTKTAEATKAIDKASKTDLKGTSITFWHSMGGVNGEAITYLVDKFNKENTFGIKVDAQYQGSYDDAINKLKSAQIGNMGADLVQIYDIGTRFMIDSGWVVPMQSLIEADKWDSTQIEPNIAAYYSVDSKLYSMPFNSSTPILYYNKNMFKAAGLDKAPTSFPEIAAVSDKLVANGAQESLSIGIYGWFFEQFMCKQQLNYVDNGNGRTGEATKVEFDSNGAAKNILTAWKSLADKGYAPNIGRGGDAGLTDFVAGKSAMTLGSTASLKQILKQVGTNFEVGTAYFPKINDADKGGVSIGGGSLWALNNKDTKKQTATWEFVKFLVSAQSQAYWNTQTGYFPITTAAHNEPVFKENIAKYPQFMTAIDQLHASSPKSAGALLSVFPEARAIIETETENMLNGKQSVDDTVSKMAKDINSAISDYNLVNK
jgi:sn-glycerol 3-phosphate transport system substrate-binding protein